MTQALWANRTTGRGGCLAKQKNTFFVLKTRIPVIDDLLLATTTTKLGGLIYWTFLYSSKWSLLKLAKPKKSMNKTVWQLAFTDKVASSSSFTKCASSAAKSDDLSVSKAQQQPPSYLMNIVCNRLLAITVAVGTSCNGCTNKQTNKPSLFPTAQTLHKRRATEPNSLPISMMMVARTWWLEDTLVHT